MSNKGTLNPYDKVRQRGGVPRETEGRALLEAARQMAEAQSDPGNTKAMRDAARINWRLWTIFQAELSAPDCPMPVEIRQNMLNLCNFVDKRVVDILAKPAPQKLDVLINVNRQIAAGLLTKPEGPETQDDDRSQNGPPAPGGFSI